MNQLIELKTVVQFKGGFPDIQPDPRVDIDVLTQGDAEPLFVTLPIAQIGNTAKTGHYYDEAFVHALADQVVSLDGLRGHPDIDPNKPGGASYKFFPSDVDWVGQMMEGDVLWGKFYVPPGQTRDYVRRVKAKAGRLSTSVLVDCHEEREASGRILMRNPQFRRVDLAPFYSAAAPVGDGSFAVTAQMVGEAETDPTSPEAPREETPHEDTMERTEIIAQMTAADVSLLPQAVVDSIIAASATSQVAQMNALSQENAELRNLVAQMQTTLRDSVIDDVVAQMVDLPETVTEEQRTDLNALLATFRTALVPQIGENADSAAIREAAQTLWDANYKRLAEALVRQMSGPNTFVPGSDTRHLTNEDRREEIFNQAQARARNIVKSVTQEAQNDG